MKVIDDGGVGLNTFGYQAVFKKTTMTHGTKELHGISYEYYIHLSGVVWIIRPATVASLSCSGPTF